MQKKLLCLLPVFLAFLSSGCITISAPPKGGYQKPAVEVPPETRPFSYKKEPHHETVGPAWPHGSETHSVFNLSFHSVTKGERVRAEYWKNKTSGKKKLIIILPIIESTRFAGEHYAHVMTLWNGNTDFNVLLVEDTKKIVYNQEFKDSKNETEFLSWLGVTARAISNYVIDIRRLVDWAETQPEINAENIGIIGGSLSATMAALVMAHEPRIRSGVFDKGGGSFGDILAESQEPGMKEARSTVMEKFGWTQYEFEGKAKPVLKPMDPVIWATNINPANILFISARDDTWIPKQSIENFWESLGKPERLEYNTGHKTAFVFSLTLLGGHYADYRIYNHFKTTLR